MQTNEYRELIELVEAQLRELGLDDLAATSNYVVYDPEEGAYRPLSAEDHLIQILTAFERHVAIQDQAIFNIALRRINNTLEEGQVEDVIFAKVSDYRAADTHSLGGAPKFGELRDDLRRLVSGLREDSGR